MVLFIGFVPSFWKVFAHPDRMLTRCTFPNRPETSSTKIVRHYKMYTMCVFWICAFSHTCDIKFLCYRHKKKKNHLTCSLHNDYKRTRYYMRSIDACRRECVNTIMTLYVRTYFCDYVIHTIWQTIPPCKLGTLRYKNADVIGNAVAASGLFRRRRVCGEKNKLKWRDSATRPFIDRK